MLPAILKTVANEVQEETTVARSAPALELAAGSPEEEEEAFQMVVVAL